MLKRDGLRVPEENEGECAYSGNERSGDFNLHAVAWLMVSICIYGVIMLSEIKNICSPSENCQYIQSRTHRRLVIAWMNWRRRRYFVRLYAVEAWSNHGLLLRNSMVLEPEGIKKTPPVKTGRVFFYTIMDSNHGPTD